MTSALAALCLLAGQHAAAAADGATTVPDAAQRAQLELLLSAEQDGLDPADYAAAALQGLAERNADRTDGEFQTRLAAAFAQYCHDLSRGRLDPSLDPDWHIARPDAADTPPPLFATADAVLAYRDRLQPPYAQYRALRAALAQLSDIRAQGGWLALPAGAALHPGARDERVIPLRNRLRISGDYRADMQADPLYFDSGLAEAVQRFQAGHALWVDGIVGDDTRTALNVPVEQRIDQVRIAMERWRWLPRQPETAHVRVNIAAGRLEVVESDTPRLAMRAIVGRTYRQTPSLAGRIDLVTINPAWTVPHTIAVEDLLPQQRQDPTFLQRNRIRIYSARDGREVDWRDIDWASLQPEHFGYTLRQDAGPDNSLGRLKFSFDNPYDIYLHGTPTPVLFRLPERTFSSGCVRIEHPDLLAEYLLLPEQHMDRAAIQAAIDRGQTRAIALEHALPVYLIYMNVWTDAAGSAHFEGDPYGRDRRLLAAWQRARMHPSR